QGPRPHGRPFPRGVRGRARAVPPRLPPPHPPQLPRRVGEGHHGRTGRPPARGGQAAALGDVMAGLAGARLLDPRTLARVKDLELLARGVVEGFTSGLHRSPYLGVSVDFAEHRAYMPGDDIRRIDWRVFARSDRFYVKQFEADSNANFLVLLDV